MGEQGRVVGRQEGAEDMSGSREGEAGPCGGEKPMEHYEWCEKDLNKAKDMFTHATQITCPTKNPR